MNRKEIINVINIVVTFLVITKQINKKNKNRVTHK